jgi:hypothetical protein
MGIRANVVDGRIYVVGGDTAENAVYDPETDSWTTKTPMPVAPELRSGWSCASAVVDGKIHVFHRNQLGGFHGVYDPETDNWTQRTPGTGRQWFTNAGATTGVAAPKRIYVFGFDSNIWPLSLPGFVSAAYDPETDSWSDVAPMPTGRASVGVAVVNDTLYVIGGYTPFIGNNIHASAANEKYTPIGYGTPDSPSPSPTHSSTTPPAPTATPSPTPTPTLTPTVSPSPPPTQTSPPTITSLSPSQSQQPRQDSTLLLAGTVGIAAVAAAALAVALLISKRKRSHPQENPQPNP